MRQASIRRFSTALLAAAATLAALATVAVHAQDIKVLNLYSARHYQTDEALYANFTKATGIKINRIEAGDEQLIDRLKTEGANSPADVILMVDAARLWSSQQLGLFAPLKNAALEARIPAELRDPAGNWFGFSTRARVIVYNKVTVKPEDVASYEALADPKNKNKVCTRSGSHPYMLSLVSAVAEHDGEAKAEAWAKGVVGNFARKPVGGDTDQIKAVASGECGIALTNTYYWVRLLKSTKPDEQEWVKKVGFIWPNQSSYGTHVNISGGGMAKNAPNKEAAVKFLEYLVSDEAQGYFANGNNEWPVNKSVVIKNPELDSLGKFKADNIGPGIFGKNMPVAQRIVDRAGWK
jgi:iron(III) transport system substrate-binding protein